VELTKNPDAMIMALRKIEDRGELARANSAVMEMCVDNPRTDFSDIFATHPSIDARCEALVKFAGGHDPGPIELEAPEDQAQLPPAEGPWGETQSEQSGAPGGPWGPAPEQTTGKPFLPSGSPVADRDDGGPWSPKRDLREI
jgi:heat shock protein HtpX